MKKILFSLCFFWGLFFLSACKESPRFANFDSEKWKNDRMACKNERKELIPILKDRGDELKGLDIVQIQRIFGTPDVNQLYKRNQRFYIYFYEMGLQCEERSKVGLEQSKVLKIRFSALDTVTEVVVID